MLRSNILAYRSRCYRRQRDLHAAQEDVERALELAQSLDDQTTANVYVQASLVAERQGHWVLARNYAERAKAYYEDLNDSRNAAGLLNNLGGLNLMLGKPEQAIEYPVLPASRSIPIRWRRQRRPPAPGRRPPRDDGLRAGRAVRPAGFRSSRWAWTSARSGLQLVLGRSLMEQGRLDEAEQMFRAADGSFEQLSSISHRAGAWIALGDLAARRGTTAQQHANTGTPPRRPGREVLVKEVNFLRTS